MQGTAKECFRFVNCFCEWSLQNEVSFLVLCGDTPKECRTLL